MNGGKKQEFMLIVKVFLHNLYEDSISMDDWMKSGWMIVTQHDIEVINGNNDGVFDTNFKVKTKIILLKESHQLNQLNQQFHDYQLT